jgi:hypothetical protein
VVGILTSELKFAHEISAGEVSICEEQVVLRKDYRGSVDRIALDGF